MYIVCGDDHTCYIVSFLFMHILLLCIQDRCIYLQLCAELYHFIVLIGWLVLPLGSSSLHFWDGLIMYSSHRMTPLTSHIRGHLLQLILPHIYGLPCLSTDSLDPMENFCTCDVSKIIPKNTHYLLSTTFKPFLEYTCGYNCP